MVSELGVGCLMISDVKAFDAFGDYWNLSTTHTFLDKLYKRHEMFSKSQSLEEHMKDLLKLLKGTNSGITFLVSQTNGSLTPDWNVKQLDSKDNILNRQCN